MHHFTYRGDRLHAEDVDVAAIAADVGTPFYVYATATLRRHYRVFAAAFDDIDALVAYSVKANSNIAVLKILAKEGAGADVVSGGELQRALHAGVPPEKIVFSGVGKTADEMAAALKAGVYQFNIESEPELEALGRIAVGLGKIAPAALRVNPDVAAGGHEKISTGKAEDKFGAPWSRAREICAKARDIKGVEIKGIAAHIGSQIADLAPFETAFRKITPLIAELRADGGLIDRLDLGGGLGIPYEEGSAPPHPNAYADMIKRVTKDLDVRLIFEPGRMIAGNAGVLVSRALYVKQGQERRFLVIDAGMNDLIRPALYDAHHQIIPIVKKSGAAKKTYDVVGPVCESSDCFARARALPDMRAGDLIALMSAGAYGAVQSSQYNSRPLAPEVLVSGAQYAVIRRRPSFEDMIAGEHAPAWLD